MTPQIFINIDDSVVSSITLLSDPYVSPLFIAGIVLIAQYRRVTSELVSRFLLNLQETNVHSLGLYSDAMVSQSHQSTLRFDRVVGSIGGAVFRDVLEDGSDDLYASEDMEVDTL